MIVQPISYYEKLGNKIKDRLIKRNMDKNESSRYAREFVKEIHRLHVAIDNITLKTEDLLLLLSDVQNN